MMRPLVLALAVCSFGCSRCSPKVTTTDATVRFEPRELTLGPTWVSDAVEETVVIKNDSKQKLSVRIDVEGPFEVTPKGVELPAGGTVELLVRFPATTAGTFTGKLLAAGLDAVLELEGIAEDLGTCTAAPTCMRAAFDKTTRACVSSALADGTSCPVANACMESGSCRAGSCVQTARSCPAPTDPCQTSFCDLQTGCGLRAAADGTSCGAADCTGTRLCRSGACMLDTSLKPTGCNTMHPANPWMKITLAGGPFGLATDSSDTAYVGLASASQVARIDTTLGVHAGNVAVGNTPTGLVSDATRVWVTNQSSQTMSVIDRGTFSVTGPPVSLGITPYIPALHGGFLYVSGASTAVVRLDPATNALLSTLSGTWSHANGIAFHPTQPLMYVSARDSGEVTEVDLNTFTVGRRFTPGQQPQALVISPDGSELYVARETGPLAVLSTATGLILDEVMSATGGFGMALTPDGSQLYLTRPGSGNVARVDRATRTQVGVLNTGGSPRRIGFSSNGTVAVITNEGGWVDLVR